MQTASSWLIDYTESLRDTSMFYIIFLKYLLNTSSFGNYFWSLSILYREKLSTRYVLKRRFNMFVNRREDKTDKLATLQLDKAALLAEVIDHVKRLKSSAMEVCKGCTLPSDVDEVRVEVEGDEMNSGSFIIRASLCCEDRPDLLTDIRQTLQSLQLKTIRAEISTLGGRVKNVIVMMCEGNASDIEKNLYTSSVHQALKSILDRVNSSVELLPRTAFSNKRRRISPYESSCSSS